MSMILREAQKALHDNNLQYFINNGCPEIAFLFRVSIDQYYSESLAKSPDPNKDPLMNEVINRGINAVPVVGDVVGLIFGGTGIDFGSFGSQSDSSKAKEALKSWEHHMSGSEEYKGKPYMDSGDDYLTNFEHFPSNIRPKMSHLNQVTDSLRPKCVSPSAGCNNEHQRYSFRCKIIMQCQQSLIDLYRNYFNPDNWNEFLNQMNEILANSVSQGTGGTGINIDPGETGGGNPLPGGKPIEAGFNVITAIVIIGIVLSAFIMFRPK